jgi:hypothetical protein
MIPSALTHALGTRKACFGAYRGARAVGFLMTPSGLVALRGEVMKPVSSHQKDKLRGSLSVALGACVIQTQQQTDQAMQALRAPVRGRRGLHALKIHE